MNLIISFAVLQKGKKMYVTTKTIITFLPEEQEAQASFLRSNNIKEWKVDTSSVGISYVRTERFALQTACAKGENNE